MLLLQRKLLGRDCAKWRTVLPFSHDQIPQANALAMQAIALCPGITFRIVEDGRHG